MHLAQNSQWTLFHECHSQNKCQGTCFISLKFSLGFQTYTNSIIVYLFKLGGVNYSVSVDTIPIIKNNPTLILGLDVWHGDTDRSDLPSIAAVQLTPIS